MSSEQEWDTATEAAWTGFRQRLADRVAAMVDDDLLVVELDTETEDGAAPYVQLCAYGGSWVRVDAVSNAYLAPRYALTPEGVSAMVALGFEEPDDEESNFITDLEVREADRVAVLVVRALREVHAVPHPAFLLADGLERIGRAPSESAASLPTEPDADPDDEPVAAFARSHDELRGLVDRAMRVVFPDLRHDEDGDIPIVAGQSAAFVRVRRDRPAVEVFAEVVVEVVDLERLPVELDLLNAAHAAWKFVSRDDTVRMSAELPAAPFTPFALRTLVAEFTADVDEIARQLAVRVGGRRFFEPVPEPVVREEPDDHAEEDDPHPAMVGLLELLHLDRVRPSTVAGLFEHDRLEIIRQLVRIRTGRQDCDGHDPEAVLTVLRKALRIVSDGDPDARRPVPLPPKPRSVQESLLSDSDLGDDALDLGWSA